MSDMKRSASQDGRKKGLRLSVRLDKGLSRQLAACARRLRKSESDIVRLALADYLPRQRQEMSLGERLRRAGILGCSTERHPTDLATNPKHMEGFGRD
jgi:predicted transcriptional regulator